ncbi:MAG: hypothetical protein Aurels2KO_53870 [Aureliella sp.]
MLSATQHKSIASAVKYFDETLAPGDYYLGKNVEAKWHGQTARKLDLDPALPVTRKQFEAALSGKHPKTGQKLIQRIRQDRRPGTDFTFDVRKSISLLWALNKDERILQVLQDAVRECMEQDVEPLVHRRVRHGENVRTDNRTQTSNMQWADFTHLTTRPVDGHPDPQLHVHAFAVNVTEENGQYYAADFTEVMRQLPCIQAKFDSRVARKLEELGFAPERTTYKQSGRMKRGWEIAGISRDTIEKFSRRTKQIEKLAAAKGVTDANAKAELGRETREAKGKAQSIAELRSVWIERLTAKEREAFDGLRPGAVGVKRGKTESVTVEAAVTFALEHHLERQSTVEKHQIMGTALEYGLTLKPDDIEAELAKRDVITGTQIVDGATRTFITTQDVLKAEERMLAFARDGMGTRYTIGRGEHEFVREWLSDEQKAAVNYVLQSTNTVEALTGGAGTGKTSTLKEIAYGIEKANKNVFTFAPSTGAKDVLKKEGFENAETVEHLIRNTKLHGEIQSGDVILIDEAGLLDTRSMLGVFTVAKQRGARVLLSGDARQHSSPSRGEAFRLLQSEAGLNAARIDKIQRQKHQYKRAVEFISRGSEIVDPSRRLTGLAAGFDLLDKLGKIREIDTDDRHAALAEQYLETVSKGKSALVIAPTHAEGEAVTQEVRERLRAAGAIGKEDVERSVWQIRSLHLTAAEKGEVSSYAPQGQVVQFHQNVKGGFKRGERYRVTVAEAGVMLVPFNGTGQAKPLPQAFSDRFEVYLEDKVLLCKGDKVRFSQGGLAKDGKRRVANGRLDEVAGFDRGGNVRLKSGMTIDRNFGHINHGYCVTSHASQGKTVDVAIAAMGAQSLPAINAKQFYVTASRASQDLRIYVDNKSQVRRAIQESGTQLSATELVSLNTKAKAKAAPAATLSTGYQQRQAFHKRVRSWWRKHRPRTAGGLAHSHDPAVKQRPFPKLSR